MIKRNFCIGLFLLVAGVTVYGQAFVTGEEGGPSLRLTGEVVGMMTVGLQDEDQKYIAGTGGQAPGFYYLDNMGNFASGKNGYYSSINFSFLFSPVPSVDVYMKLLAQYRPGSPYIPLQLEDNSPKTFDNFAVDSGYGRVNAVKGLGFDTPLDIWLKVGKFDTTPAHYNRVSRYGAESAMNTFKTMNRYSMQLEAAYEMPWAESVSAVVTTHLRLNEELAEFFDEDVSAERRHGTGTGDTVLPINVALRLNEITLPFGSLSWELLYAYNTMHIFSGHSFGLDGGANITVSDSLSLAAGVGVLFHEKNIDVLARTSVTSDESDYLKLYTDSGYDNTNYNDINTKSLRQSLRVGAGVGARYDAGDLTGELNLGLGLTNIAHIYRETLSLLSLSVDLRATLQERYFIGGGIYLGTLADGYWYTREDVANTEDISTHVFSPAENMGWEVFAGLQFNKARFVIGFNSSKGLAMNNSIESVPEAQIKYKQKDTQLADGLFERGGLFTKLIIAW
jgi:hypothetical protein